MNKVRIFYRRNARRITARRCSDGSIRITAPYGFNPERNQHIIQNLVDRLTAITPKEDTRQPLFHDGSTLEIEGLTLHVNQTDKNTSTISATINRGDGHTVGYITVPRLLDFNNPETETRISNLMIRIAGKVCGSLIINRAEEIGRRIGVKPVAWKIGRGHRTLGTCHSDRSITLSAILAFLPADLQEFVICHELAHLSEMNHSERFHHYCNSYLDGRESKLHKKLKNYVWPIRR